MNLNSPHNAALPPSRLQRILFDGRWIVIILVALYGLVWNHYHQKDGWVDAWRHMRVAGLTPAMFDMRGMLGAFQNYRDGVPMEEIQNPSPGSQAISFTYPEAWMIFSPLGLTEENTAAMTLAASIACVLAWLLFAGPLTVWEGFLYGLITISPSLMLGVERGNGDLFIFLFIVAACALVAMRGIVPQIVGNLLFLFSGVLKIYPIAGLTASLKSWKAAISAVLAAMLFMAYIYVDRADLRRVNQYTSRDASHSFGARVFTDNEELPSSYGYGMALVVIVAASVYGWRVKDSVQLDSGRFGTAFLACAAMFIICFLIGNNYVYRFRLFLLILPQALIWAREKSWPAMVLSACMFLTVYASNEPRLFALSEPLNWLTFGLLLYFVTAIVFRYLRAFLKEQFEPDVPEPEYL